MIKNVLIFVIGFFCGALFLNLLCINALNVHKTIIKAKLSAEQQMLAQRAQRDSDFLRALIHRWNVVDLNSKDGFRIFRKNQSEKNNLGFSFPFAAIVLRQIEKKSDPAGKGKIMQEGLERAQLALAMEEAGMPHRAAEQWEKAAKLSGQEISRMKRLAENLRKKVYTDYIKKPKKLYWTINWAE